MSSGGSTPAVTNQINKVELPEWVNQASQSNYQLATDIANRPLEQYSGPTVAGQDPMTLQANKLISSNVGSLDPYYKQIMDMLGLSTNAINTGASYSSRAAGLNTDAAGIQQGVTGLLGKAEGALDQTGAGIADASAAFGRAGSTFDDASNIFRGTTGPLDITRYLNPYTDEVESRAIANANTALDQRLLSTTDAARKAGAFGGSRHGIQSGVTAAEGVRSIGDLSALLRKAGIDFATDTAIKDRAGIQAGASGMLGAGSGQINVGQGYLGGVGALQNTAAGYGNVAGRTLDQASGINASAAGLNNAASGMLNAATGYGNVATGVGNAATGVMNAQNRDIGALASAGAANTASAQAQIDAAMRQFYEKRDYPIEGLNTRLAALGMSPYGKTETSNKTATSEDKGPDWASILLGGAKIGSQMWMASDRGMKTDIERISDGPVPMYAYRYKKDPKTYPKVVGPMAQDIEKYRPKSVKKIGKRKVIDINNLMESLA